MSNTDHNTSAAQAQAPTPIATYAARHREGICASSIRAADLKALGWQGLRGEAVPLVLAEIERQRKIHLSRISGKRAPYMPPTAESQISRRRGQLARLRYWRQNDFSAAPAWDGEPLQPYQDQADIWRPDGSHAIRPASGAVRVGNLLIKLRTWDDCDWDRYSKSWHSQYGPAKTRHSAIQIAWEDRLETRIEEISLPRVTAATSTAVETVARLLNIPKQRGHQTLRIYPWVELIDAGTLRGARIHERRLAGATIGYVAVRRGQHYHAPTAEAAADGLARKLALARRGGDLAKRTGIDWTRPIGATLRAFGFCKPGVADALDMLGLDDRPYDPADLIQELRLESAPKVARKYPAESARIAEHIAGRNLRLPARLADMLAMAKA